MLKKTLFGDDHEIKYDSIINHDTYTYLRVSLEVPRGQTEQALVLLNGKEVGKVIAWRKEKKTLGYMPYRKDKETGQFTTLGTESVRELGRAVASIISDYAR
jgi:hypothetical protein